MEHQQIQRMMEQEEYEELIELLEEEDYDEYFMMAQCHALLFLGKEKEAKKVLRKMKMLFPAGDYLQEIDNIYNKVEKGEIAEFLMSINKNSSSYKENNIEDKINKDAKEGQRQNELPQSNITNIPLRNESVSLSTFLTQSQKKVKKKRVIPETIKDYFIDVIGMEQVQITLDKFYKLLRFQNERKQNDFNARLLKTTHFAIAGQRGCGKTLVGEIIGALLYDFGIRGNRETIRAEASELKMAYENDKSNGIDKFLGQISDATVIIENIQDWFHDEQTNNKKQLLIALEKIMKDKKDNMSIILTGTEDSFKKVFAQNETLEDALHTMITMPSYSTIELIQIAQKLAKQKSLLIHESAKKSLIRKIDIERSSSEFLNAITLERYLDNAALKMAERYFEMDTDSEAAMVYLMPDDFEVEFEEENLEELLGKLDALTGLNSVKKQIKKRIEGILTEEKAQQVGAARKKVQGSLHMIFTGNPGTGKTTVARMLGKIYQQLGILPRGSHLVECTRSGLVGQYQGHTANLVKEKVREAIGGILFIDEAYSLCRDDKDTFGHEAVDELIAQIENNKDNLMVILAGYKNEMTTFMKSNPGFASRIRNSIEFEDYSTDEMMEIFKYMVTEKNMFLEEGIDDELLHMIQEKSKTPDFGNARGIRNLYEETIEALNTRILEMHSQGLPVSPKQYDLITKQDIEFIIGRKTDNDKTIEELMEELNALTGLKAAKDKIQEIVDDIQVKEYMKQQSMNINEGHGTLHLVFKGTAGTGKTTVARLIGKIYKKLGILKKNVFVEVGRKDLVANYSGQTATKVIKKIEEAEGGILFIDEAYTLNGGERDEFGHEAINTLVAELENRRETLMVIVAGYAKEMNSFLELNQGLTSRLSNEIIFEDYTDEEMINIFKHMVQQKKLILAENLDEIILITIQEQRAKDKDFGNARGVRNVLERVERKKNSRIAILIRDKNIVDEKTLRTIVMEDFQ